MPLFSMSKDSQLIESTSQYIRAVCEMNPCFTSFKPEDILYVSYFTSEHRISPLLSFVMQSPMKADVAGLWGISASSDVPQ